MPLLADSLSVWDIGFRLAGHDPRKLWFRIPLEVEDHFRNFMEAILKGDLGCENIELEKRHFDADEKMLSVYYWIDDIYDCMFGRKFNRKLLRWAHVERFDLMLWCERMNAPLPEFWFPHGWNLQYELPEGHISPGHYYIRKNWTTDDWKEWHEWEEKQKTDVASISERSATDVASLNQTSSPHHQPTENDSIASASKKLRPNQEACIACQQIAKVIWKDEPDRTIASVVKDERIQKYGGGNCYVEETVREWVRLVAPAHVKNRRGAPRKNGG